jgi:pimeloyl-ACP methyl ester carboxylesterase
MSARLRILAVTSLIGIIVASLFTYSVNQKVSYKTLKDYYAQQLSWNACYDHFQCTDLAVPINYNKISEGTFSIAVLRYQAQDPKHRIGSLIVNPGGPGASGVQYAYNAEYIFSPDITDRYDVVGFDPRGVSGSEPIRCFTDKEADANFAADSKLDSQAELDATIKDTKEFINKCLKKNDHITSFSTANAARDMDILRAAVGDSKLNYMGKSYGTYLGALYAKLFPNNIGHVVLDGAVDPTISNYEQTAAQAVAFDGALASFIDACKSSNECPLAKDSATARNQIISLFASTAKRPLPLKDHKGDKRVLTESLMVIGTASALYDSENGWPTLMSAISEAMKGYGDSYIDLADQYTGRQSDGTYPDNEFDSGAVIDCLDFAETRSVAQIEADAKKIALAAPVFGPYLGYGGLTCKYFPATKPVVVTALKTNVPIIVIGTTRDPATPYAWAIGLHKILTNSQLLTFVGDGHTGQGRGNACVDDAIDAFYLRSVLPKADLRCS